MGIFKQSFFVLLLGLVAVLSGCGGGGETVNQTTDTSAPTVSISNPSASGTYNTSTADVSVSGSASDNIGVDSVAWSNDRGGSGTASGTSNWSVASIALQTGDNEITVTATDGAGNNSSDVLTVTYTANDSTPPTATISSPTSGATFATTATTINLGGTASDNVGVTEVAWSNDRGGQGLATGTDSWSVNAISLQVGANLITVTAEDAAGNSGTDQITITRTTGSPGVLQGIGILGDSNSDEYRADDDRGGAFASVTFNWMEQLVLNRGLNFGPWGTRPTPRRSGYAYNWALSGATAGSMIDRGQHTGLAAQVAAGDVTLVLIHIGFNDFARQEYADIYNGVTSGGALSNKINSVINNITLAVDTVQAAGAVEIVMTDLFDYSVDRPQLLAAFPDPVRRQVVTDAIRQVNTALASMAQQRGVVLIDITASAAALFATVDQNGFINVGGELIDTINPGNEPHFFSLDDAARHAGTVANGLNANSMFIETVNAAFGTTIAPFTDLEILQTANIAP